MNIRSNSPEYYELPHMICPECGAPMRLAAIFPLPSDRRDEISFRCEACDVELKRVVALADRMTS